MSGCRCADCGFLAARNLETRGLVEVETGMRECWAVPRNTTGQQKLYEELPICAAGVAEFDREVVGKGSTSTIRADRTCPRFTDWQRGFTPKEHQEMLTAQAILTAQQQQREQEREWQAGQAAAAERGRTNRTAFGVSGTPYKTPRSANVKTFVTAIIGSGRKPRNGPTAKSKLHSASPPSYAVFSVSALGKYLSTPAQPIIIQVPVDQKSGAEIAGYLAP